MKGRVSVALGFLALILVGAVVLAAPFSRVDGAWGDPVVSLFTACSAVCVTGLSVVDIAANVQPSARGEIEITTVNNVYLERGKLSVELLGRGMAWLDTGTYDGLLEASNFIATIQKRQGMYVSCIEEIAFRNGWLDKEKLLQLASGYKTDYGEYLSYIAETGR